MQRPSTSSRLPAAAAPGGEPYWVGGAGPESPHSQVTDWQLCVLLQSFHSPCVRRRVNTQKRAASLRARALPAASWISSPPLPLPIGTYLALATYSSSIRTLQSMQSAYGAIVAAHLCQGPQPTSEWRPYLAATCVSVSSACSFRRVRGHQRRTSIRPYCAANNRPSWSPPSILPGAM